MPDYKKTPPPKPNFGIVSGNPRPTTAQRGYFSDATDNLANGSQYYIQFEYIHGEPSVRFVAFKAFLTSFQDSVTSNWNEEEVYGRNDPIYTFQGNKRTVTISWDVPAASVSEAQQNLARMSKMMRFLYPSYKVSGEASSISKPPLLRIKFTNLLKRDDVTGLLGKLNDFSFEPDVESGWFQTDVAELYPKLLRCSCTFDVIHEQHLGWNEGGPNGGSMWERKSIKVGKDKEIVAETAERQSWPFMPYGTSADRVQINPNNTNGTNTVNPGPPTTDPNAEPNQGRQKPSKNSTVNAQGTTKSNEVKNQETTNPTERDEQVENTEVNRQEEEARQQTALNNR